MGPLDASFASAMGSGCLQTKTGTRVGPRRPHATPARQPSWQAPMEKEGYPPRHTRRQHAMPLPLFQTLSLDVTSASDPTITCTVMVSRLQEAGMLEKRVGPRRHLGVSWEPASRARHVGFCYLVCAEQRRRARGLRAVCESVHRLRGRDTGLCLWVEHDTAIKASLTANDLQTVEATCL